MTEYNGIKFENPRAYYMYRLLKDTNKSISLAQDYLVTEDYMSEYCSKEYGKRRMTLLPVCEYPKWYKDKIHS